MDTSDCEIVHETEFDGVPIRVHVVRPYGTYQPRWTRNGCEQRGHAHPTVREAVEAAKDRIRWDAVGSNPNA